MSGGTTNTASGVPAVGLDNGAAVGVSVPGGAAVAGGSVLFPQAVTSSKVKRKERMFRKRTSFLQRGMLTARGVRKLNICLIMEMIQSKSLIV